MTAIGGLITIFDGILSGSWSKIWDWFKTVIRAVFTAIGQIIRTLLTEINTFIKNSVGIDLLWAWNTAWNAMGEWLNIAWEYIKSVVSAAVEYVKWLIQPLIAMIQEVKNAADSLVWYVSDKISQAKAKLSSVGSSISSGVSSAYNYVTGARASGWPVQSWKTYLVGENGPELFTTDKSGSSVPNWQLRGWMSLSISFGGVHITNGMDMQEFTNRIRETIYKEYRSARLWL